MILTLSPIRSDATLTLERCGDILIVNGQSFDFGPLEEGDRLPFDAVEGDWLVSDVVRKDGRLSLSVALPHSAEAPHALRFPEKLLLDADGPVRLPTEEE
jgi:hypothetical protein